GPDHAASLEPGEFKALVSGIREVEAARGEKLAERALSQGELINRENLAKSLVAARDLSVGTVISESDIAVKSPGQGLS
ncbi:SAF domain-containing protein, partial [Acinetobacter baumannii]